MISTDEKLLHKFTAGCQLNSSSEKLSVEQKSLDEGHSGVNVKFNSLFSEEYYWGSKDKPKLDFQLRIKFSGRK